VVSRHAVGTVEVTFANTAPDLSPLLPFDTLTTSGPTARITTSDPARVTSAILAGLGHHAGSLRGLSVSQPSLETAFLGLTEQSSDGTEPVAHVA
jgi:hypothetical protein